MGDMYLTPVAVIFVVFAAVTVLLANSQLKAAMLRRQDSGMARLQLLRQLLSHVQKHRGLTTSYLSGYFKVMEDIEKLQETVLRDFSAMSRIRSEVELSESWDSITQHWARLSTSFFKNDIENNLVQHNRLVQSVLFLIEETAVKHDLSHLQVSNAKAMSFLWRELLGAIEVIGQTRAIGTVIATQGDVSNISQHRLRLLRDQMAQATETVWSSFTITTHHRKLLDELLRCIDERLLVPLPLVSPDEYFEKCTALMDCLYDQYDQLIHQLRL